MSLLTKSLLAWLLLLVVMFVNGFFRVLVLQPRFGEQYGTGQERKSGSAQGESGAGVPP